MASPRSRSMTLPGAPPVPIVAPPRPTSRQLALPLPPVTPLAVGPPPLTPSAGMVRPQRVWARLPLVAQTQIRQTLQRVFEEVVRDELHDQRRGAR